MSPAPFLEWRLSLCDTQGLGAKEDLGQRLRRKFSESAYHAVRRIACDVRDGRLMLRGRLPAYLVRQVTQLVFEELDPATKNESWQDLAGSEA
jgi:hypothetical protein